MNVKEHTLQPLIQAKNRNIRSQKAAFFISSDSGFNMHFASHGITEDRSRQDCWYMMPLREDFTQTLRTYKQLPITSFETQKQLMNELQELRELNLPNSTQISRMKTMKVSLEKKARVIEEKSSELAN